MDNLKDLINISNIRKQSSGLIFVLFLIISGNYLGELFPCKIQKYLTKNVYLKHCIGLLTLIFFVVFTDSDSEQENFKDIVLGSIKLYILFLLLINTHKSFFIFCIISSLLLIL